MTQNSEFKALTDDRGCLKRLPIERRQPVHARQHQALDRSRDRVLAALLGVAQELLKKQWIAARAVDAGYRDPLRRIDEAAGEAQRLVLAQRPQIDRDKGRAVARGAPGRVDRIALD